MRKLGIAFTPTFRVKALRISCESNKSSTFRRQQEKRTNTKERRGEAIHPFDPPKYSLKVY